MKLLVRWVISAIAIILTAYLLPGIHVASFVTALVIALVLGILNTLVKPLLFLLTLPITLVTLGLFALVLNAFMILLVSSIVPGFSVDGFLWALLFSIVLSIVTSILDTFLME